MPPSDFLQDIQMSHFLKTLPPATSIGRDLTPYEHKCVSTGPLRRSLSCTYHLLLSDVSSDPPRYLEEWEEDLDLRLRPEEHSKILMLSYHSSNSNKYQEMCFKLMTRWYRTLQILHRIYPQVSDACQRCGNQTGDLMYIYWACRKLLTFWTKVHAITQKILMMQLNLKPALYLFPHTTMSIKSSKEINYSTPDKCNLGLLSPMMESNRSTND